MNEVAGNNKLRPALIGGASMGVASAIPVVNFLNCACCALVIGGGFLSSYLYLKDQPRSEQAPYGDGAIVGLLAGLIGAVVGAIVSIPFTLMFAGAGMMSALQEAVQSGDLPPELEGLAGLAGAGGLTLGFFFIGLMFNLVIYSIFSTLGGVVGVAVMHKKGNEAEVAPPPPPPV
jgi:hypothetical protein